MPGGEPSAVALLSCAHGSLAGSVAGYGGRTQDALRPPAVLRLLAPKATCACRRR